MAEQNVNEPGPTAAASKPQRGAGIPTFGEETLAAMNLAGIKGVERRRRIQFVVIAILAAAASAAIIYTFVR